jgi:hypothetical protein
MIYTKFDWNWPAGSFIIDTCKYGDPHCGPSRPPGTMTCSILNLHYIRKLSCKYDIFWLSGSWRRRFLNDPTPLLWLSPLWRVPGPLFEQFRIPFKQGWFVPNLFEIGLLILEKKMFKRIQYIFTLLVLSSLGEGQSFLFEQFRIRPRIICAKSG